MNIAASARLQGPRLHNQECVLLRYSGASLAAVCDFLGALIACCYDYRVYPPPGCPYRPCKRVPRS